MDNVEKATSFLPQEWQDDISDNFYPEYLAEKLSDYIVQLEEEREGKQLVSECAISYLFDQWPSAYKGFYERLTDEPEAEDIFPDTSESLSKLTIRGK